jgi:hypothetical protein
MFGEYQSTMILCEGSNQGGPFIAKNKIKALRCTHNLINMDLQEGMVTKDI